MFSITLLQKIGLLAFITQAGCAEISDIHDFPEDSCHAANGCTKGGNTIAIEIGTAPEMEVPVPPVDPICLLVKRGLQIKFTRPSDPDNTCTLRGGPGEIDPQSAIEIATNGGGARLKMGETYTIPATGNPCSILFFCEENPAIGGAIFTKE